MYCRVPAEDSIFIQVFNLPLKVAHYSNIVNDRNQFHVLSLMPDGAGLVCGENKV